MAPPTLRSADLVRLLTRPSRAVDLIVEGCGALTPTNRRLATAGVWLDLDASQRRLRALARDGETFAPHWERWAAQERAHWAANRPADLADVVVAGERITTRHLDWAE